jgi:hypothetical protein
MSHTAVISGVFSAQGVKGAHLRSVVAVAGVTMYSSVSHSVKAWQTRSEVGEGGTA